MECTSCGHLNEPDAKFCRECGTQLVTKKGVLPPKAVEFAPTKRPTADFAGGIVVGVVFIVIGCIIALAIFTTFFSDFGTTVGSLGGDFGEMMGNFGEDFGNFFGNFGETIGTSVGSFFEGLHWWNLIQIILPAAFIIPGVILIAYTFYKRR
ncbi:MAG: zinc ribbon domain-containing protein [Candidatus Heimdallarchaeota archaeon]|nr:MAG: zinc ribbon domain-containing protein [Candidatus Heimdallarchaeota archaeon]